MKRLPVLSLGAALACVILVLFGCAEFTKTMDALGRGLDKFSKELEKSNKKYAEAAKQKEPYGSSPRRTSTQRKPRRVVVILVHGTTHSRAFGVNLGTGAWASRRDPDGFAAQFRAAYKSAESRVDLSVRPFRWNGDNSNSDRHNAGIELARLLDAQPSSTTCHIIAHSHGGNVALRALTFSRRDASSVILLGTPHIGVNATIAETGKTYRFPLYLPLPKEAAKTKIVNIYSDKDSVAKMWADLMPGAKFSDLRYTNAEAWRSYWKLDRVRVGRDPATRGSRGTTVKPTLAVYDFTFGDGVISPTIPEGLARRVVNINLSAKTAFGQPQKWVHRALVSQRVARALGRAIAKRSFSDFRQRTGVLTK